MRKMYRYMLNDEQKSVIYTMLMGPYEKSWYNASGIVENSDDVISKRLGVTLVVVNYYTGEVMRARFGLLNKLRDAGASEDVIAMEIKIFDDRERGYKI